MCLTTQSAKAFTGNDLYGLMNDNPTAAYMFVMGVTAGLFQAQQFRSTPPGTESMTDFCKPNGVTNNQIYDIVKKTFENEPENRHHDATVQIMLILSVIFPCEKP